MNTQALRQKILDLAIRGKLVSQDPNDEPASVLLERIRTEKQQMVKDGKLKIKDIKGDTIIFKGEDNLHYEKFHDGTVKCIEDEIPFDIPEGWVWCRLGTLFMHNTGKALNSSNTEGIKLPYITTSNVYWEGFELFNLKSMCFSESEIEKCTVVKGDLLVCEGGDIGRSAIWNFDEPIMIQNHIHRLRAYLPLETELYYYFMYLYKFNGMITGNGIGLQGLSSKRLHAIIVPLPPINEQQRIVKCVEQLLSQSTNINKHIKSLKGTIENIKSKILDLAIRGKLVPQNPNDEPASVLLERIQAEKEELIKQGKIKRDKNDSVIFKGDDNSYYELFRDGTQKCIDNEIHFDIPDNWRWCRLKNLAAPESNSFADGPFGSNLKREHYTDTPEVRIIQLNNIGNLEWKDEIKKYTTYSHAQTLERCKTIPGDIVIAKMMPAGRAIIVPNVHKIFVISSDNIRLRLSKNLETKYVYYMINSPSVNRLVLDTVQGVGRTRTSLGKLREIICPIPPIAEQERIVTAIEKYIYNLDIVAKT